MATVNLDDLKPNSHKYKEEKELAEREEKKKLQPIVKKGGVVTTKKSLGEKFRETFLEEDIRDVKDYIIFDAIIPGIKNLCLDALEMFFFGGRSSGRRSGGRDSGRKETPYHSYYKSSSEYKRSNGRHIDRDEDDDERSTDYRNIVLRYSDDAKEVVDQMRGRIHEYGQATVADLFDLVEITGKYTDNNWGWTREEDIGIRRVSSGYLIDVTEAKLLD